MKTGSYRFSLLALLAVALLLAPLLTGCGDDKEITGLEGSSLVAFSFTGLEPLEGGLHYQAWVVAGTPSEPWGLPVVIFNVDDNGQMVDPVGDTVLAGPFPANLNPEDIQAIGISLEVSDTLLSYSSFTFLLGGDLAQGSASLETNHWIAFSEPLAGLSGRFILATPTDDDPENELSGIWFVDTGSTPVSPGLDLPEAPEGWIYEGWVSLGEQVLSTGKFSGPLGPDTAATYSGPVTGPPFPGEDFLTNPPAGLTFPPDLSGSTVFITLEPWMESDVEPDAPFFLRILDAQIPADAVSVFPYDLTSLESGLPTGTATVQGS